MTELPTSLDVQPRARGAVRVSFDDRDGVTRLRDLRQAGSLRALFPRNDAAHYQMVLTNTSGGITGGDRFTTEISVDGCAGVSVTTQAAERAYRAQPGETGRVETRLRVGPAARLNWLPQETILFDGCALRRRLTVGLHGPARALIVEPVVFGRTAMGERVIQGVFDDRIEVTQDGVPVLLDRVRLAGDVAAMLARPAVADGAGAMAVLVYVAPDADARLAAVRALLPETAGASLLREGLLVARCLARDSFELRRALIPVIDLLHDDILPRPWMI